MALPTGVIQAEFRKRRTNMAVVLGKVLATAEPLAREKNISLHFMCDAKIPAFPCDPQRMRKAAMALVENAMRRTAVGGHVAIRLASFDQGLMELSIWHTVPEVGREEMRAIGGHREYLARSRTSQPQRWGSGWEPVLASIEAYGGWITLVSDLWAGDLVRISLPVWQQPYGRRVWLSANRAGSRGAKQCARGGSARSVRSLRRVPLSLRPIRQGADDTDF